MGLPPVTATRAPDTYDASSLASSTYTGASSAGWPGRPIGTCWPKLSTFSSGMVAGISGVQIGPGATLFARMPLSAYICARLAVKFAIAAFVMAYGARCGLGMSEFTDDELMIDAPGCMCGIASLHRWNIAERLTARV